MAGEIPDLSQLYLLASCQTRKKLDEDGQTKLLLNFYIPHLCYNKFYSDGLTFGDTSQRNLQIHTSTECLEWFMLSEYSRSISKGPTQGFRTQIEMSQKASKAQRKSERLIPIKANIRNKKKTPSCASAKEEQSNSGQWTMFNAAHSCSCKKIQKQKKIPFFLLKNNPRISI